MKENIRLVLALPPRALKVRTAGLLLRTLLSPADTCEANTGSIYGDGFYKLLKTVDCLNKGVDERLKAARVTLGICEGLYEVGGKIGQGSYGVVFKGTRRSDKSEVAIKFVSIPSCIRATLIYRRNHENATGHSYGTNTGRTNFCLDAVSYPEFLKSISLLTNLQLESQSSITLGQVGSIMS